MTRNGCTHCKAKLYRMPRSVTRQEYENYIEDVILHNSWCECPLCLGDYMIVEDILLAVHES